MRFARGASALRADPTDRLTAGFAGGARRDRRPGLRGDPTQTSGIDLPSRTTRRVDQAQRHSSRHARSYARSARIATEGGTPSAALTAAAPVPSPALAQRSASASSSSWSTRASTPTAPLTRPVSEAIADLSANRLTARRSAPERCRARPRRRSPSEIATSSQAVVLLGALLERLEKPQGRCGRLRAGSCSHDSRFRVLR